MFLKIVRTRSQPSQSRFFELKSVSRPIANHLFFFIKIQKRRELQLTRGNVHSHNSRVITAIFGVRPTVTYYNKKKKKKNDGPFRLKPSKEAITIKYYAFEEDDLVKERMLLSFAPGKTNRDSYRAIYARNFRIVFNATSSEKRRGREEKREEQTVTEREIFSR